jgi:hypothetical protein
MIAALVDALVCLAILGYCFYACRTDIVDQAASAERSDDARSTPARCEHQAASKGTMQWTSLDDRQLTRLLRDAAS